MSEIGYLELVANVLTDVIEAGPRPEGTRPAGKKGGTPGEARQNAATIEGLKAVVAAIDAAMVAFESAERDAAARLVPVRVEA